MGNEFQGLAAHSAEYFGDHRDHWWRDDLLRAAAIEWDAPSVRSVLDVGCGVGHWGRLLARTLPPSVRVTGIDREPLWVEKATEKAAAMGLSDRFSYRTATVESLPFPDATFDMVTCQTVLMHTAAPEHALAEMVRVTRSGGLIVAAEPTNLTGLMLDSIILGDSPDVTADLLRFHLICLRGKKALGEGNELIGEALPAMLAAAGLRDIHVRSNDRPAFMIPPYETAAQRAFAEDAMDSADREIGIWSRADTHRYFIAGGGREADFETLQSSAVDLRRRVAAALRARTYSCSGGMFFYLIWGRKT